MAGRQSQSLCVPEEPGEPQSRILHLLLATVGGVCVCVADICVHLIAVCFSQKWLIAAVKLLDFTVMSRVVYLTPGICFQPARAKGKYRCAGGSPHCCSCFTRGGFLGIKLVVIIHKALKRSQAGKRACVSRVRRQQGSSPRQVNFDVFIFTVTRRITNLLVFVPSFSK